MWLLALTFVAATLLLSWMMAGYLVWLRFAAGTTEPICQTIPDDLPTMSVIVPCYNEADLIEQKLENLLASNYPADRLEIIFADGGSTDGTPDLLERALPRGRNIHVVRCPRSGKVNQLNHVLKMVSGDIVVNSDVDARLETDTLGWLAAEFAIRPKAAVVGACCSPIDGLSIEKCYWAAQNRCRVMESNVAFTSVVIAGCYAFRRDLLSSIPEDVVADDAYIAALANSRGMETIYSQRAAAYELRAPQTLFDFLSHKYRKSNAVLRETLRFAYRMPDLPPRWRLILLTRLGQLLSLPWVAGVWVLLAVALVTAAQFDLVGVACVWICGWVVFARAAMGQAQLPKGHDHPFGWLTIIQAYVCTMAIVLATGISYPFFRQGSCYARLGANALAGDGGAKERPTLPEAAPASSQELPPIEAGPALSPQPSFGT